MIDAVSIAALVLTAAGGLLGLFPARIVAQSRKLFEGQKEKLLPQRRLVLPYMGEPKGIGGSEPLTAASSVELDVHQFLGQIPAPGTPPPPPPQSSGRAVLAGFAVVVVLFAAFAIYHYWNSVAINADTFIYAAGLFLTMVAGMFVQVITSNHRDGRDLFAVTSSQLIYPLLFSLVVFYSIWAVAASSPHNLFSFYAAFLNGYFWESVVTKAQPPSAPPGNGGVGAGK